MFGIHRYVLAHLVMIGHLWPAWNSWCGYYAVFGFYVLSGYLMTMVLRDRYGSSIDGVGRFVANRALRIYPPYWVAAGLTLAALAVCGASVTQLVPSMRVPASPSEWLQNLFIFGLNGSSLRLVPPAWSLDVELVFYGVMAVIASRSRWISIGWLALSVVYTGVLIAQDASFAERYAHHGAASLPFALGSVIQWFEARARLSTVHAWIAPAAFVANALFAVKIWGGADGAGFYVSLLLAGYSVLALAPRRASGTLRRLDSRLGDLSYTVFLVHQVASVAVAVAFLDGQRTLDARLLLYTFPVANAVSLAIHLGVEVPIERLRRRIRSSL